MCKLRKSSALIFVFLSPGIGCYLSVITFPQEQMTTIPDPVANIACAEETTLMSSRKRKGWGGQCSPMDRIKPSLQPYFPFGCQRQEEIGRATAALPTPRAISRCGEQDSLPAWTALRPAPLSLQDRTHREFTEPRPAPRRGASNQEAAPSLPVAPLPFRPRSTQGRAQPGRGAVQPVRGWVGRVAPASQRTWC